MSMPSMKGPAIPKAPAAASTPTRADDPAALAAREDAASKAGGKGWTGATVLVPIAAAAPTTAGKTLLGQ